MKEYVIPVTWSAWGRIYVQANSLREAVEKADTMPLPTDHDYIDDSFRVDVQSIADYNETDVAGDEEIENLLEDYG